MKLHKNDLKYKKFLKLERRMDELSKELAKVPARELKEPYQKGWIVTYELKPEIKRRKDAPVIQEVANLTYGSTWIRRVEWVKAIRSGAKKVLVKGNKWHSLIPGRHGVKVEEYNKFIPAVAKYFDLDTLSDLYKKYGHKRYFATVPQHWMVLKARPHIVTHERVMGGPLQKEYDRLNQEWYSYWATTSRGNYSVEFPKNHVRTEQRSMIQKFKKGEIDDISTGKIRMIYND